MARPGYGSKELQPPLVGQAARRAATAVHTRIVRQIARQARPMYYARVLTTTEPMTVELADSDLVLTEGVDFRLTQLLRWWDVQYAIQPDDVLTLLQFPGHEWLAFDVKSIRNVDAGVRMNRPPAVIGGDVRPLEVSSDPLFVVTGTEGLPLGDTVHFSNAVVQFANNHVVRKMEVYDKDANRLGWVPVFDTLP